MKTIEHSGGVWESLGYGKFGIVWPIEEYLARCKHSPAVAERIKRLNPNGKEEGEAPRGWHPHARVNSYMMDVIPISRFRAKYGAAALRILPKSAFSKIGGKRRAITHLALARLGY